MLAQELVVARRVTLEERDVLAAAGVAERDERVAAQPARVVARDVQALVLVDEVFAAVGLQAKDYVEEDPALYRPSDIRSSVGTAARARERLGWNAQFHMRDVARAMVNAARGAPLR